MFIRIDKSGHNRYVPSPALRCGDTMVSKIDMGALVPMEQGEKSGGKAINLTLIENTLNRCW